jgi:hypothetical protein
VYSAVLGLPIGQHARVALASLVGRVYCIERGCFVDDRYTFGPGNALGAVARNRSRIAGLPQALCMARLEHAEPCPGCSVAGYWSRGAGYYTHGQPRLRNGRHRTGNLVEPSVLLSTRGAHRSLRHVEIHGPNGDLTLGQSGGGRMGRKFRFISQITPRLKQLRPNSTCNYWVNTGFWWEVWYWPLASRFF